MGLFQHLEVFYENKILFMVFAVAGSKEVKTDSGMGLMVNDAVADLKGREEGYEAVAFSCSDAVPVFRQHAEEREPATGLCPVAGSVYSFTVSSSTPPFIISSHVMNGTPSGCPFSVIFSIR